MSAWEWHSLLAAASAAYSWVLLWREWRSRRSVAKGLLLVCLAAIFAGYAARAAASVAQLPEAAGWYSAVQYAWVVGACFLLAALANLLRDDKPSFARYPVAFTLLPLVLIPFYPLISDTLLIQDWVLGLYQAGALLISLFLFGLIAYRDPSWRLLFTLWPLFAVAWTLHWLAGEGSVVTWLVPVLVSAGMILSVNALRKTGTVQQPELIQP